MLYLQEILLRRCVAALHAWQRIAAARRRRTSLLVEHATQEQQHKLVSSIFSAWRKAVDGAKAAAAFILHSLSAADRGLLLAAVTAWKGRAIQARRLQALR